MIRQREYSYKRQPKYRSVAILTKSFISVDFRVGSFEPRRSFDFTKGTSALRISYSLHLQFLAFSSKARRELPQV